MKLRISFLGSRGIPARYSGFETLYEQLGVRLAAFGHAMTVYTAVTSSRTSRGITGASASAPCRPSGPST